ncbi:MAG: hypothetical protein ABIN24_15145 [Dyadobacter sp.]
MMRKIYYILLAGILLGACQKSSIDKKEEGIIHYKETVSINGVPPATLTFFDVTDSRCPEGGQCIWAGNAEVDLVLDGVTTEGKNLKHVKMCLGECSNFKQDTLDQDFAGEHYTFILKSVTPYPKVDIQNKKTDYSISLEIKKK